MVLIVLSLASCSKEETVRDITVQFNATVSPEILTKGAGTKAGNAEAVIADHAVLQAWLGDALVVNVEKDNIVLEDNQIDFGAIRLVGGVDYDVYIWVDSKGYYETDDLRNVRLNTGKSYNGKTPEFDAFYTYTPVNYKQDNEVHNVTLKRPFAKVSFSAAVEKDVHISFTVPNSLDLKTGKVSGSMDVGYDVEHGDSGIETFDYIFADEGVSQLDYTFKLGEEEEKTTTIPVSRNTKTNVIYTGY